MIQALDDFKNRAAAAEFERNLKLEGNNLTEKGEKEAWISLKNHYSEYRKDASAEKEVAKGIEGFSLH